MINDSPSRATGGLARISSIRLSVADANVVRQWSRGEVWVTEWFRRDSLEPVPGGLFCERIFGPVADWRCACGKEHEPSLRGQACKTCGVEVALSRVRRERLGHIELAAPVAHPWFVRGDQPAVGLVLDIDAEELSRLVRREAHAVVRVDSDARDGSWEQFEEAVDRAKSLASREDQRHLDRALSTFKRMQVKDVVPGGRVYQALTDLFGEYFEADTGPRAIQQLLSTLDLAAVAAGLRAEIDGAAGGQRRHLMRRLQAVRGLRGQDAGPKAIILEALPVLPPDLRPVVQLDDGDLAVSHLTTLYRDVLRANIELREQLAAGEVGAATDRAHVALQTAVDALFGSAGPQLREPGQRTPPLQSLTARLEERLGTGLDEAGKRVDYSGSATAVADPELDMHQCGLPWPMAVELFKPFVMKRLVDLNYAQNIKSAKRMVERQRPQVWDVLEEVIVDHPVIVSGAAGSHRLGLQAFMPALTDGAVLRLHPMAFKSLGLGSRVSTASVHVPLSAEAQSEAQILMLAANNVLSPATGLPLMMPEDALNGLEWLTRADDLCEPAGTSVALRPSTDAVRQRVYSSVREVELALDGGTIPARGWIRLRVRGRELDPTDRPDGLDQHAWEALRDSGQPVLITTTPGRAILNDRIPANLPWINDELTKAAVEEFIDDAVDVLPMRRLTELLKTMNDLGFRYAVRSEHPGRPSTSRTRDRTRLGADRDSSVQLRADRLWARTRSAVTERDPAHVTASVLRALSWAAGDVTITDNDCGTGSGLEVDLGPRARASVAARVLARPVEAPPGDEIPAGTPVSKSILRRLASCSGSVLVRSPLTCESAHGLCATCYGAHLAERRAAVIGDPVGLIAAQSVVSQASQLRTDTAVRRTQAGRDISRLAGLLGCTQSVQEQPDGLQRARELLEVLGVRAAQLHLVGEVQEVYRSQGVPIHDKHVELIVRQMFRRVHVLTAGDTEFLPGENVDRVKFKKANDLVLEQGGEPAAGRQMLMGITDVALATDSWLSAASFHETARVLAEAALEVKSDPLVGLKENVIVGRLIPAGTGVHDYTSVRVGHTLVPDQAMPAGNAHSPASVESFEDAPFLDGWGQEQAQEG